MKTIIRLIKRLFGYEYYTYYVEYSYYSNHFSCVCTSGPDRLSLIRMAYRYKLNVYELEETLCDTCTIGHIYPKGRSYITLEVKVGKYRVVENNQQ